MEALVDVCQHVLSLQGVTPAATARAALAACEQLGMLKNSEKYRPLVHDYDDLRLDVLADFRDDGADFVSR